MKIRRSAAAASVLGAVLVHLPVHGLDPSKAITQYLHDSWRTADGLPIGSIRGMAQTSDGYIWLATEEGLVRCDGARFVTFDGKSTPELGESHNVGSVSATHDGSLWLTTVKGLIRLKDGRFRPFREMGFPEAFVTVVREDAGGTFWMGTAGKGLVRYRDGVVTILTRKDGLPSEDIRDLLVDRAGTLWIGTNGGGLCRLDGERTRVYTTRDGLTSDRISRLCQGRDGSLWIGTFGAGVNRLKDGTVSVWRRKDGLPDERVLSLLEDRDGSLWIGTVEGLCRLRDGTLSTLTMKDGLAGNLVFALLEDREGSLWVGSYTGDGLDRLRDGKLARVTAREGLTGEKFVFAQDRRGTVWIGSSKGLARLDGGNLASAARVDGLSGEDVNFVCEDRSGTVWVGTVRAGLRSVSDGKVRSFTARDGLSSDAILSFHQATDGSLWVGTAGGLNRLEGGKGRLYSPSEGALSGPVFAVREGQDGSLWLVTRKGIDRLKDGRVTNHPTEGQPTPLRPEQSSSFLLDGKGTVWLGTLKGLVRIEDGAMTTFTVKDGLAGDIVVALLGSRDGSLWVGTIPGLARVRNGVVTSYPLREGPFGNAVFALFEDDGGNLWTQSNKGLFRIERRGLDDYAEGRTTTVSWTHFDTTDGLPSDEGQGGSGYRTRDGRLWFPTWKGVAVVDPARIPTNTVPPPVLVEEVHVDGRPSGPPRGATPLVLPAGTAKLEIRYTATSFVVPRRVKFRYRLEGYDRDWVDAGTERVAHYTNLPPRAYTFRVIACNDDGLWNETGASVAITLLPRFWQTRWFLALEVLAGLGILAGALLLQRRRLDRRKARELAEELRAADHARKTEELEAARRVQLALLPKEPLTVGPFTVAGRQETATEVGGDWFGYLEAGGKLCVVVGDATGHGMASGLVAGMLKSALAALARKASGAEKPTVWLADLNDALRSSISKRGLGVCVGIALVDVESGAVELGMAGIPNPFLVSASGAVERLPLSGTPLGYVKRVITASATRTLAPGDRLVLLTDGLVEQVNGAGEEWGYAGIEAALAAVAGPSASPGEIAEGLLAACERYGAGQARTDDRTVVVLARRAGVRGGA